MDTKAQWHSWPRSDGTTVYERNGDNIYQQPDGMFVISTQQVWIPGVFKTFNDAELALSCPPDLNPECWHEIEQGVFVPCTRK